MGVRKTNLFVGTAASGILMCAAASGAVECETAVRQRRAGPAVVAVIFLSDVNEPGYVEPAAAQGRDALATSQGRDALATVDAGKQSLEERIANTDLSTLIKVYRRLAEETLRSQGREDGRQGSVRYVYLSPGVDWPMVRGQVAEQNLLRQILPALAEEGRRAAAGRRVTRRWTEELAALNEESLYERLETIACDPAAVEAWRRLAERARAQQDVDFEVAYGNTDAPQRQWSQTVVPEPSTAALLAMGCAMACRRRRRRG